MHLEKELKFLYKNRNKWWRELSRYKEERYEGLFVGNVVGYHVAMKAVWKFLKNYNECVRWHSRSRDVDCEKTDEGAFFRNCFIKELIYYYDVIRLTVTPMNIDDTIFWKEFSAFHKGLIEEYK